VREATVHLETPRLGRAEAFLAAVRRSRALHGALVAPPATRAQYRAYLARIRRPTHHGYFVCLADGELAGVINVNEIVRGLFQSAYLGFYALAPHAGRGHMRAGLALVIEEAFRAHGLHRLEANVQPRNRRSRALVRGLGFRREGFSPRYLRIAGRWRDHERWALTVEDWKRGGARVASSRRKERKR
jgi:ribosomal-protein-alanine N-acetyltransferase